MSPSRPLVHEVCAWRTDRIKLQWIKRLLPDGSH
jgi:hypothetical protein